MLHSAQDEKHLALTWFWNESLKRSAENNMTMLEGLTDAENILQQVSTVHTFSHLI